MDQFEQIFSHLAVTQIDDAWRRFAEQKETILEDCAARGWSQLQGPDIGRIHDLAVQTTRDLSDKLIPPLENTFAATGATDIDSALSSFCERIKSVADGLFQSVIETVNQCSDPPPESRAAIKDQLRYELDSAVGRGKNNAKGRLMTLAISRPKSDNGVLIAKPTFLGFGIDLVKLVSWVRARLRPPKK